ncbi:multiubiquitin domain-containing protein, partial [Pseudomonas aeruginosa]
MTTDLPLTPSHQPNAGHSAVVKINGEMVDVRDWAPTARQILAAAGLQPVTEYVLLSWPEHGPTEELGLDETISLPRNGSVAEFLAMQADAVFYFMLNDLRFAWAGLLTTEDVRKVGRVPNTMEVWLEYRDEPDMELEEGAVVNLLAPGVERMYSRRRKWKLDVHGVLVESLEPEIVVRDALLLAGIDPDQGWIIRLKVRGEPKREVGLADSIDLTKPEGVQNF